MDLDHLGATRESAALLDHYAELAGDPAPAALRHHYVAYRAFVRAKVSCLRHAQGDPTAAADSSAYADLSVRHLRSGDVRLFLAWSAALTTVASGPGKTTAEFPVSSQRTVNGGVPSADGTERICACRAC